MSTVIITPGNNKQFDLAFALLAELGKGRKPYTWDGKEDLGFAFLMKDLESAKEVASKTPQKK